MTHRLLLASLLLVGCVSGATALSSSEGGVPDDGGTCAPGTLDWHVRSTGAFTYESATDETVTMDLDGTLSAATADTVTLATTLGDVAITLDPAPASGLAWLPVGLGVVAHFEHGVVLTNTGGTLLAALVAGMSQGTESTSFDVGPIEVQGAEATCTYGIFAGNTCLTATTYTRARFTLDTTTLSLAPSDPHGLLTTGPLHYQVANVLSWRQPTDAEGLTATPDSGRLCAPLLTVATVVSIGLEPNDVILPRCGGGAGVGFLGAGVPGWRVDASGAITYASSTSASRETPIDVDATLAAVDAATSSITLTTLAGDVVVTLDPVRPEWLAQLVIGDAVTARFQNGFVMFRASDRALLLAVVAGLETVRSPSFDVGPIHIDGGDAICTNASFDGTFCWLGGTSTETLLTLGAATATVGLDAQPVSIVDAGHAYEVIVVGTVRQASGDEVFAATTHYPCAPGLQTATVVAIGPDPDVPAMCAPAAGRIAPTPGYPPTFSDWGVSIGSTSATTAAGTLSAVDASSFDITTSTGTIHVALHPIDPDWLAALPIGRAVSADFANGVVLRDATDDSVLLALVEGIGNVHSPSFDVGPVHVDGGDARCVALTYVVSSCMVGGTATDATVTIGATTRMLRARDVATRITDGTYTYDVALVASMRQSDGGELAAVGVSMVCAPALMTGTVIALARVTP